MTTQVTPELDGHPWPTLGAGVCEFIEERLVHGPGDLRGQPAVLDDEKRGLIYRMYEVYPHDHPQAGRRRFKRAAISLRKGSAKTELLAFIAAVELHPEGPVRCDGWRKIGRGYRPIGAPVTDPYIPLVAYTEEQSDDLAYAALYVAISEGPLVDDFDIGLERIMRLGGDGKAVSLAFAPNARDGARTTFQGFDETHRFTLPRHLEAHRTMLANIPKRKAADAWSLETTTSPALGEGSVAEHTMEYAAAVADGRIADPRLFFFHRQASDGYDLNDPAQLRAAVIEASGPVAEWSDIESIVAYHQDPQMDPAYFERIWLNRARGGRDAWLPDGRWELLESAEPVAERTEIVLGFDGSYDRASVGLVGCTLEGHLFVLYGRERTEKDPEDWRVPTVEVNAAVASVFDRFQVVEFAADQRRWASEVELWTEQYGEEVVVDFPTGSGGVRFAKACGRLYGAVRDLAGISHDGHEGIARHLKNAAVRETPDGAYIVKGDRHSTRRINLAAAAVIAYDRAMWRAHEAELAPPGYVSLDEG